MRTHKFFVDHGVVTNTSPGVATVFTYTSNVVVSGTNYTCIIGIAWKNIRPTGIVMAVTKQGEVIEFDADGRLRVINFQ